MKYYIIAGEASGDLHGGNLLKSLKQQDPAIRVRGWGGDSMKAAGMDLVKHYRDLAFMGFLEVLMNLRTILKNLSFCKNDILSFAPDVIILIDYPGFNLRMAEWAKKQGIRVVYYISPQIWAWKENRVHAIKKSVDLMLVILPFEKAFYQKWGYPVHYVGHPLVEVIDQFLQNPAPLPVQTDKPVIALLPGSRKQEILAKLPVMLSVINHFPQYSFVVAKAPGLDATFYADILANYPQVQSVQGNTYALLSKARAALVTSGTATLETALFGVPEIICYKGHALSYHIAKRLIKVRYIGLVNLIMDKEVVKELIQDELTTENLLKELDALLHQAERRQKMKADYDNLRHLLRQGGHASAQAAGLIHDFMQGKSLPQ